MGAASWLITTDTFEVPAETITPETWMPYCRVWVTNGESVYPCAPDCATEGWVTHFVPGVVACWGCGRLRRLPDDKWCEIVPNLETNYPIPAIY